MSTYYDELNYLHVSARVTAPDYNFTIVLFKKTAVKCVKELENLFSKLGESCSEPLLCQNSRSKVASATCLFFQA